MLRVCCFCDQVGEDSKDQIDQQNLVVSRHPKRQGTVVSFTCCPACLQDEPQAITFRTRQRQPTIAVSAMTRARRSAGLSFNRRC